LDAISKKGGKNKGAEGAKTESKQNLGKERKKEDKQKGVSNEPLLVVPWVGEKEKKSPF